MAKTASRNRSAKPATNGKAAPIVAGKKRVLQIGVSSALPNTLHPGFKPEEWDCVRLDPDANVKPDIHSNILELKGVVPGSYDAVWMPHILQRLYPHDCMTLLQRVFRSLNEGGFVLLTVPDAQLAATYVANNRPLEILYSAPAGDVTAHDMLYGFSKSIAKGLLHMAHHTGFTTDSLSTVLREAGFCSMNIRNDKFELTAVAHRFSYDSPQRVEKISISYKRSDEVSAAPAAPSVPQPQARSAGVVNNMPLDMLDQPPLIWTPLGLKK